MVMCVFMGEKLRFWQLILLKLNFDGSYAAFPLRQSVFRCGLVISAAD